MQKQRIIMQASAVAVYPWQYAVIAIQGEKLPLFAVFDFETKKDTAKNKTAKKAFFEDEKKL